MRRRSRKERSPLNAEINVVSLIDVMMLMMVIFMITAPMMQGGIDVTLPKASAAPLDPKGGLIVSVDRSGTVFVGDAGTQRMSLAQFRSAFAAMAERQGKEGVFLRADRSLTYDIVVQVLDVIHRAGVANVGMVMEPEEVGR